MAEISDIRETALRRLRWPLGLTRAGMACERLLRAFWPLISVLMLSLAALMFGLHEVLALEVVWAIAVFAVLGSVSSLIYGVVVMRWPSRDEALARLDATLPGRPITAILDRQAIGSGDPASVAVWHAHVERMTKRAARARAVNPDLQIAGRDPYALRYVALLAFVMAVIFGSVLQISSVTALTPRQGGGGLAAGPAWEGWVEPLAYTGKPSIYLADVGADDLSVPVGSRLSLRLYGEIGALTVAETVSGRLDDVGSAADPSQSFQITRSGSLKIDGDGG
ncbi:MAG: DUF4175 family protein, partial [Paracoccaceae bacterium]